MQDYTVNNILLQKFSQGDKDVIEKLIINNQGLVRFVAYLYVTNSLELDDLIQQGNIGLYKAIQGFDLSQGFQFSTYAVPMIRKEITDYTFSHCSNLSHPRHVGVLLYRYNKALSSSDKEVKLNEVAENLNVSVKSLENIKSLIMPIYSLDANFSDDRQLGDRLSDSEDFTNIVVNKVLIQ